jgi:hypothetical protein
VLHRPKFTDKHSFLPNRFAEHVFHYTCHFQGRAINFCTRKLLFCKWSHELSTLCTYQLGINVRSRPSLVRLQREHIDQKPLNNPFALEYCVSYFNYTFPLFLVLCSMLRLSTTVGKLQGNPKVLADLVEPNTTTPGLLAAHGSTVFLRAYLPVLSKDPSEKQHAHERASFRGRCSRSRHVIGRIRSSD